MVALKNARDKETPPCDLSCCYFSRFSIFLQTSRTRLLCKPSCKITAIRKGLGSKGAVTAAMSPSVQDLGNRWVLRTLLCTAWPAAETSSKLGRGLLGCWPLGKPQWVMVKLLPSWGPRPSLPPALFPAIQGTPSWGHHPLRAPFPLQAFFSVKRNFHVDTGSCSN